MSDDAIVKEVEAWLANNTGKYEQIGNNIGNDAWEALKKEGSGHYKTGKIEPIDLYRSLGAFRHFAICSIIKYAARNVNAENPISEKDMGKVIHYAKLLMAEKAGE